MRRVLIAVSLLFLAACDPNPLTAEIMFKNKRAKLEHAVVAIRACGESGKIKLSRRKAPSGCDARQDLPKRLKDDLGAEVAVIFWDPDGAEFLLRSGWDFEHRRSIRYWRTPVAEAKHRLGRSPTHWTYEE